MGVCTRTKGRLDTIIQQERTAKPTKFHSPRVSAGTTPRAASRYRREQKKLLRLQSVFGAVKQYFTVGITFGELKSVMVVSVTTVENYLTAWADLGWIEKEGKLWHEKST